MLYYIIDSDAKEVKQRRTYRRRCFRLCAAMISGVFLLSAIVAPAEAAPIFSENFQGIPLGALPVSPGSPFDTISLGSNGIASVDADAAVAPFVFGPAAGNQYLRFVDGGTGTPYISAPVSINDAIFMLTFDFYDPADSFSSGTRLVLSNSNNAGSGSNRVIDIGFQNGTLQNFGDTNGTVPGSTYSEGQKHSITIVGNYTNAGYNYTLGGSQSVAPGRFDLFLNGSLVTGGNDLVFRNGTLYQTGSTHFGLSGPGSAGTSATYFDNISITIVPEPSSIFIYSVGLLGMVACRRRNRR